MPPDDEADFQQICQELGVDPQRVLDRRAQSLDSERQSALLESQKPRQQWIDEVQVLPFLAGTDCRFSDRPVFSREALDAELRAGQGSPEIWAVSFSQLRARQWTVSICIEHIDTNHDSMVVMGAGRGLSQSRPDATITLDAVFSAMTSPGMPNQTGRPHRPLQLLIAYRLKDDFDEIQAAMTECRIACVLETKEEAKKSAKDNDTDYMGRNTLPCDLGLNRVFSDSSGSDEETLCEFNTGDLVEIHGLQRAKQHNGKRGSVRRFRAGRYEVHINGEETRIRVKPGNLTRVHAEPSTGTRAPVSGPCSGRDAGLHLCGPEVLSRDDEQRRVIFAPQDDPSGYSPLLSLTLAEILTVINSPTTSNCGEEVGQGYDGYYDWGVPEDDGDMMNSMMRNFSTQFWYGDLAGGEEPLAKPDVQLKQLLSVPVAKALSLRSDTPEHAALCDQLFVINVQLSKRNAGNRGVDGIKDISMWRQLSVFGGTRLDTLHDKILAPAIGWVRHYHSYMFIVPTNGACFCPSDSGAIDQMHVQTRSLFGLDDSKYCLAHVLREPGAKLVYLYDLGDSWYHTITLEQVVPAGGTCKISMRDEQHSFKLRGVQLLNGEVNCPPEDSNGLAGMGDYGSLLAKGRRSQAHEAHESSNWRENGIWNPFEFNLVAHARRLRKAVADKSSAKFGQRVYTHTFPGTSSDQVQALMQQHQHPTVPHRTVYQMDGATESVRTAPDERQDACCALCGRQEQVHQLGCVLSQCGKCRSVYYCGRDCQKEHWTEHKHVCDFFQFEFAQRTSRAISAVRKARRGSLAGVALDEMPHREGLKMSAESTKQEGNASYKSGDVMRALICYSNAVDLLHQMSDELPHKELSQSESLLLATSLANRAQCYMYLQTDPRLSASWLSAAAENDGRSTQVQHVVDDCIYARGLLVEHTSSGAGALRKKITVRLEKAMQILDKLARTQPEQLAEEDLKRASIVQQESTSTLRPSTASAAPAQVATRTPVQAPSFAPAAAAHRLPVEPDTSHICAHCGADCPKDEYTRNQWKKRKKSPAKCKSCVGDAPARVKKQEAAVKLAQCTDISKWLEYHQLLHCLEEFERHRFDIESMRIIAGEGEKAFAEATFDETDLCTSDKEALVAALCPGKDTHATAAELGSNEPNVGLDDDAALLAAIEASQQLEPELEPEPELQPEPEPMSLPAMVVASRVAGAAAYVGNECSICLEQWVDLKDAAVVVLSCQHATCFKCMELFHGRVDVLSYHETADGPLRTAWACPLCRAELPSDLLEELHASFQWTAQ